MLTIAWTLAALASVPQVQYQTRSQCTAEGTYAVWKSDEQIRFLEKSKTKLHFFIIKKYSAALPDRFSTPNQCFNYCVYDPTNALFESTNSTNE